MTEEEIIADCVKGKERAQKALFDLYSRKLMGICLRYASDHDEAQDMLQDGFIKIFQKLGSFNSDGSFEGWLRRTMVNTCLDHLRRTKNLRLNVNIDSVGYLEPVRETATSKLATEELLKLVQALPTGYKTVFNMFAIEGYSHREIGEALGISENTSKSQFRKAKLHLQQALEELNLINWTSEKAG